MQAARRVCSLGHAMKVVPAVVLHLASVPLQWCKLTIFASVLADLSDSSLSESIRKACTRFKAAAPSADRKHQ
jgi:hypothetical protein